MELLVGLALYLAPALVAGLRHHHNHNAILALNLLLGWTVIGWIIALIWALTAVDPARQRPKVRFGSLLDTSDPHMPARLRRGIERHRNGERLDKVMFEGLKGSWREDPYSPRNFFTRKGGR